MPSRRSVVLAPAALAAAAPLVAFGRAEAAAPLVGAGSPLVQRIAVGAIEVTAIGDGSLGIDAKLLPGAEAAPETTAALLQEAALVPGKPIPSSVNTYLVNTGSRLVLIDTGVGSSTSAFGPNLGRLQRNLAAAGVAPEAIDAVLITHLHPDHALGLTVDGKAAFANAELVVGTAEHAFWTDAGIASRAPAEVQPFFTMAQAAIAPYAARTRLIGAREVAPGITFEPMPGHTPGHGGFRVASGDAQLLIWGDVVHVAALQFAQPGWSVAFDSDPAAAAATRSAAFDAAAADRVMVAGMHLAFPGFGYVARRGQAYAYVPANWPLG